jgi:hypothetical protein
MQWTARYMALAAAVAVLPACDVERITVGGGFHSTAAQERGEPWLVTDRTVYTAHYTRETIEITIGFRFHNHSRFPVAVPRCTHFHRPVLDKLVGDEWVEVFTPLEACWSEPLVVGAGRYQDFTFRVQAGRPHTVHHPQFQTTRIPGIYRLRWDVYQYDALSQFRVGAPLPIEHRVSNEFRIVH